MKYAKCVLVVEDDENIAMALRMRLHARGYGVVMADGIESAQQMLAENSVDLAVVDVNLVDGSGFDLIAQMRRAPATVHIPAISVSASKRLNLREDALAIGAFEFVEKPFRSAALMSVIESALEPESGIPDQLAS